MDRRRYLKTLTGGTVATGLLLGACGPETKKELATTDAGGPDRQPAEIERYKKLMEEKFFDEHEMKTITLLADIIIPKDEVSGSASDAKVPDFIEFIVKDMPRHKVPVRGGLRWLDVQCMNRYSTSFAESTVKQQMEMVDEIAWPKKAKPGMEQGVSFFNLMRDLTASGFYTSKIGVKDIGYMGNQRTQWDGVPKDVLDQFGVAYDARLLPLYITFNQE